MNNASFSNIKSKNIMFRLEEKNWTLSSTGPWALGHAPVVLPNQPALSLCNSPLIY